MSKELHASKVVVLEEEPQLRGIATGSTSVAGAVGVTERGPVGVATLCSSAAEYQAQFGGYTRAGDVALAAKGFFENGGSQLWVSRVVGPGASSAMAELMIAGYEGGGLPAAVRSTTAGPLNFEPLVNIILRAGSSEYSLMLQGNGASISFEAPSGGLWDGATLRIVVDGTPPQTVTFRNSDFFDIHAPSSDEIAQAINRQIWGIFASDYATTVTLATSTAGTISELACVGGTAANVLGILDLISTGSGTVPDIRRVGVETLTQKLVEAGADSVVRAVAAGPYVQFETLARGSSANLSVSGTNASLYFPAGVHWGGDGGPTPAILTGNAPPPFRFTDVGPITVTYRDTLDGPNIDATLNPAGTAAEVKSSTGHTQPFALANNQTLIVAVNGAAEQTVTFTTSQFSNIGAATAAEVRAVIEGAFAGLVDTTPNDPADDNKVVIRTLRLGSSAQITVTGGTAATTLGLSGASAPGTGNVADMDAVTIPELITLASLPPAFGGAQGAAFRIVDLGSRIRFESTLEGAGAYLAIPGSGYMDIDPTPVYGSDAPPPTGGVLNVRTNELGPAGNRYSVKVATPVDGGTNRFDLVVYEQGVEIERFAGVTRDDTDPRYVEAIVNDPFTGSKVVNVTDEAFRPGEAPDYEQTLPLTGGNDDIPGLRDADFLGSEDGGTGLYAFDNVQDLSLVMIPGGATPAIHNGLLQYCEVARDGMVFAILDPPAGLTAAQMVTYVSTTASLENASEYGAIYWPRVQILNPDKRVFGPARQIVVPPSGIVAGVYARTDSASPGGVYVSPAGVEAGILLGVLDFETDETRDERKRDLVYPHRINPLTTAPGLPKHVDGSRTLKGDGAFPFVGERRGVIFIERSLKDGLELVRHRSNTPELRGEVSRTVTAFLLTQMRNGAFASRDPSKAFFVDVSDSLNTPSVIASGRLLLRIGLATNKPTEFVVLEISQDTRALEAELSAAG